MQPHSLQRAAWGPLRGSACCAGTSACASPSPPSAPRHAALCLDPLPGPWQQLCKPQSSLYMLHARTGCLSKVLQAPSRMSMC